jgi:hypothetical protein
MLPVYSGVLEDHKPLVSNDSNAGIPTEVVRRALHPSRPTTYGLQASLVGFTAGLQRTKGNMMHKAKVARWRAYAVSSPCYSMSLRIVVRIGHVYLKWARIER